MNNKIASIIVGGIFFILSSLFTTQVSAQEFVVGDSIPEESVDLKPSIIYSTTAPKKYEIAAITVSGVDNMEHNVLINLSGLSIGQRVSVPGEEITQASKRFWNNGLFSNVVVTAEKTVGDKIYLNIHLEQRPKVADVIYHGIKKGESDDLNDKIGIIKGSQITPNMLNRAEIMVRRYYDEKGFNNADIRLMQRDDANDKKLVYIDVYIDKKEKVKVNSISLKGNQALSDKEIKKVMKKTNEKKYIPDFLRTKKFIENEYTADKEKIINKYNELGFRDAYIATDSVISNGDQTVNIYLTIEEGEKYYIRNIDWVGNTVYNSEALAEVLKMRRGDTYNQKRLQERLANDEDAVGNLYYNSGYVFYDLRPVEVNVTEDSIDLEMRIVEGPQATFNRINISGNDRIYENVVRRELYTRPGDLFTRESIERSYRQIAQMGHFNPENIVPDIKPDATNGTVDLNWELEPKSNDQIELSMGWGQTGLIGKVALKFTNFSMRNLTHKSDNYRGFIPQGDGQTFSISGQTNGQYYHSYSLSFLEPWLGGKRPNSLSVNLFYSKQSDVSDNYYNSDYFNNYNNYMYGYGNYNNYSNYDTYESYYDPDKYIKLIGTSVGWGKRLHWPDDYFTLYAELSYTRYNLKNWSHFLITDGSSNNINLGLTIGRNTTDNPVFPRVGSDFSFSVYATPPYSLWDGIDYKNLATSIKSEGYMNDMQKKYKWIEYHKWKFKSKTYTALTSGQKCLVLMTRADFGILGQFNKYKKSPFETFYMGGDGMSGASYSYGTEIIGLRGYGSGSFTPYMSEGYAYSRLSAELRFPLMLESSTTIYALAFMECGNAWTEVKKINPFDMKRSAGAGVRVFLPMVGLMGIDWAYGFDSVFGSKKFGGSQIHFILGQEF